MHIGMREIVFIIVLFAIPLGAFQYVFRPRNAEMALARKEIAEKGQRLAELNATTTRINDLGEAITQGEEAIDVVEAKLPSEQNVDEVLRQVWKLARRHNLIIKTVEPKKRVPASQYMELPISVELEGNFDGFYEFLRDIEQMPRLTRMKELDMKKRDDEDGAMDASFLLSVYFQPQNKGNDTSMVGVGS